MIYDILIGFVDHAVAFLTSDRGQAPITIKATARDTDPIHSQV